MELKMKLYRVFLEYFSPHYEIYAALDKEGEQYIFDHFDYPEAIPTLPKGDLDFEHYADGVYQIAGQWHDKDFGEDGYAKLAV